MDVRFREPPEELLRHGHFTTEELADLLEMSPYTIRHAIHEGRLKAFCVDHQVIDIRREDVLAWLRALQSR
jgi:excisionase family DNA binding protein